MITKVNVLVFSVVGTDKLLVTAALVENGRVETDPPAQRDLHEFAKYLMNLYSQKWMVSSFGDPHPIYIAISPALWSGMDVIPNPVYLAGAIIEKSRAELRKIEQDTKQ